jgi:cobalt/nickel transport protein
MNKFTKKIFIGLIVLAILSPLGLFIPEKFHTGDAWGEWSLETVKSKLGFVPKGMEKNAEIWKAPLPDYGIGNENNSRFTNSMYYIISGFTGIGLIGVVTYGLFKLTRKNE